jgi:hypothetical protein
VDALNDIIARSNGRRGLAALLALLEYDQGRPGIRIQTWSQPFSIWFGRSGCRFRS